jgi:hypothetical protein
MIHLEKLPKFKSDFDVGGLETSLPDFWQKELLSTIEIILVFTDNINSTFTDSNRPCQV